MIFKEKLLLLAFLIKKKLMRPCFQNTKYMKIQLVILEVARDLLKKFNAPIWMITNGSLFLNAHLNNKTTVLYLAISTVVQRIYPCSLYLK